jgi:hypothetical protein
MLKNYADLKSMMEELEEKNLDPDTKILFGDSDTNSYNVFKARVPFAKDILDYEFDEDKDGKELSSHNYELGGKDKIVTSSETTDIPLEDFDLNLYLGLIILSVGFSHLFF